jgi:hypothetical protein
VDDEVRRLLADFADRAIGDQPAADVDEDVARGRRAVRRVRLRLATAGVLAAAAAVGAVVVTGGPLRWFAADSPPVGASPASPTPTGASVTLTKGLTTSGVIGCELAPAGWRPQPTKPGYAVLAPPAARTDAKGTDGKGTDGKLVLHTSPDADRILRVSAVRQPGRIVHLGWYENGDRVAQTKLGDTWLIVQVPRGGAGWDDTALLRFVESCSLRLVPVPVTPHN